MLMTVCSGINKELEKWILDTLGKRSSAKLLGYAHSFIFLRISQLKDHSISVNHDRYATSAVENYLDTATSKVSRE